MKVKLNSGVEYWVSFHHENYTNTNLVGMTNFSKCIIENKTNPEINGTGIAVLSKGDKFCKDKGRKLAMKRAMKDVGLAKPTRTLFWNEYHKLTNKLQRIK